MRIEEVRSAVDLCLKARITPFIWGRHGIGKSTAMRDLCFMNDWGFVDERLSQAEAADLRGLPARDEASSTTVYYAPAQFPRGDMTLEAIVNELAATLEVKPLPERIDGASPLQALRLSATAGRRYRVVQGKLEYDGDEYTLDQLRLFHAKLKRLQPRFPAGMLFLDEFNRGEDDVLQCSFELVLDRSVGMYQLPPMWGVVAAGNYTEGYSVNPMMRELALMDRFCHLDLGFDLEDWAKYMLQTFGESAQPIVEFGMQNQEHVTAKLSVKNDIAIQPSPRSWDAVARIFRSAGEGQYSESAIHGCVAGLIGSGLAVKFVKYVCPVKARTIIDKGVNACLDDLAKITRDPHARGIMGGLVFGVLSFSDTRLGEVKTVNNLLDFAQYLAKTNDMQDLSVAFMRQLLTTGNGKDEPARAALLSNERLASLVGKYSKGKASSRVLEELNKRPDLKKLMKNVSWGNE